MFSTSLLSLKNFKTMANSHSMFWNNYRMFQNNRPYLRSPQTRSLVFFTTTKPQRAEINRKNFRTQSPQSSQDLLKSYFSSRLTLSALQLERYLIALSKNNDVKIRDHRWESLYITIQKYHKDFSLQSKIQIIQALARMKQNNSLFLTLYRSAIADFHKLSLEQMSVLIWSMVKTKQTDKSTTLAVYKKLYAIIQNDEKIVLKGSSFEHGQSQSSKNQVDGKQNQIVHNLSELNFVHLVWSLQKTKIIDNKLILQLLKHTFQDKQNNFGKLNKNIQQVRIQNLCLLTYCITQLQFEKYRISQSIANRIRQMWEELQKLSILSLVLLCESFSKFVHFQEKYLIRYEKTLSPQEISRKNQFISKQKKYIFLIAQTILLKQNRNSRGPKLFKKGRNQKINNQDDELFMLNSPLSCKFASQIVFHLGRINLYNRKIWYQLLTSITKDVDQAQVQDLSMALVGICNLKTKQISPEEVKQIIFQQKKIISKRVFQIYTSLSGKSLTIIQSLIFQRRIQNQLVPSRIRKQVQQQFMSKRLKDKDQQQQKPKKNNGKYNANRQHHMEEDQGIDQDRQSKNNKKKIYKEKKNVQN